jgi:hypothetical protein
MTEASEVVCAWCSGPASTSGETVSHGICVDCAIKFLRKLPKDYLASVAEPDGTVILFEGRRMDIHTGEAC